MSINCPSIIKYTLHAFGELTVKVQKLLTVYPWGQFLLVTSQQAPLKLCAQVDIVVNILSGEDATYICIAFNITMFHLAVTWTFMLAIAR